MALIESMLRFLRDRSASVKREGSETEGKGVYGSLKRIQASSEVSEDMKLYAQRLVDTYLPAVYCTYAACEGNSDTLNRLNKDLEELKDNIISSIESCLLDIEHGAYFDDNLSNPFINCLLAFEQVIDDRVPKN